MRTDFRSTRIKLSPEAFALSTGKDLPPTDLVDEDTWKHITHLADDVSLRTSDHFGSRLKESVELWSKWISVTIAIQHAPNASHFVPLAHVTGDAGEYFQGSIHNALVG